MGFPVLTLRRHNFSFLETEDADRHLSLAIGTPAIIDAPIPLREKLTAALSERIRHVPRLTQLVHQHPFELAGLKSPCWWVTRRIHGSLLGLNTANTVSGLGQRVPRGS
jgi:hypothetical protein